MLRVGAVSYLNTRPLVRGLDAELAARFGTSAELVFDLPSRLADDLAARRLDVALIPTIEFLRGTGYQIVSDAVIACRGPVWSVRLLSRKPVAQVQTLALDEGSRTSQALARILLKKQYGLNPELLPFPIDVTPSDIQADALLMIGDRAMHPPADTYHEIWDLGDRWCRWSELPFVFAVWAAHSDVDVTELAPLLESARDRGVENFRNIAQLEAGRLGLTVEECLTYFSENLYFYLGAGERQGLDLFRLQAMELGMLDQTSDLCDAAARGIQP